MNSPTIQNHPSDEQMTEFSAGSLAMTRALCISAHIDHCRSCQQRLTRLQYLASAQLENLPAQNVSQSLKSQVMQQLKNTEVSAQCDQPQTPQKQTQSDIPRCLHKWVTGSFDELNWSKLSPSISISEICSEGNGSKAALVKVKAGGSMAHHSHTGEEVTVILQGSFSDEDGIYCKGDYLFRQPGHKHNPIVSKDQDCICLMVLDAPIQFTGWFSRLLNPILRLNHKPSIGLS